ncbi:MAG: hypothetical protein JWO17_1844 [Actinomycetia bacterium]|nr:hypothetical protein [Actinomycetes bacterium]
MAHVSAHPPTFVRGSAVLDYWLVHAEGLTVEPLGARVEEVVVAAPIGHAEALIVRSRMTRRRRAIPAASIAAVEPSTGRLLMDARTEAGPGRGAARLSPERMAAARINAGRGQRFARAHAATALRLTWTGSIAARSWLRPRVAQVGKTIAQRSQLAAVQIARGVVWLVPRLVAGARRAVAAAARLTLTVAVIVTHGVARTAREVERVTAVAAERGRASLEGRRARRGNDSKP